MHIDDWLLTNGYPHSEIDRSGGRGVPCRIISGRPISVADLTVQPPDVLPTALSVEELDDEKLAALENIRRLRRPFPPGWKFDREEANERPTDTNRQLDQTVFELDESASEAFADALANPPQPVEALRELMQSQSPFDTEDDRIPNATTLRAMVEAEEIMAERRNRKEPSAEEMHHGLWLASPKPLSAWPNSQYGRSGPALSKALTKFENGHVNRAKY